MSDQDSYDEEDYDSDERVPAEDSSSSDDDQDSSSQAEFEARAKKSLYDWALECRIKGCHLTNLQKRLINDFGIAFLPRDSRTLLRASRGKVQLRDVPPGQYFHFGLINGVRESISKLVRLGECVQDSVGILINIDGVPMAKSSGSQFWPILGMIYGSRLAEPFVIGIYHGYKKPSNINVYLEQLVSEFINVRQSNFICGTRTFRIYIAGLVCDAPARCLVTNVVSHNAYYSCHKCCTRGVYVPSRRGQGGRVTFPQVDAPLRTDAEFRSKFHRLHHNRKGKSCIEDILSDLVRDIPIDYMHAVLIGAMKKLFIAWTTTKFCDFKLNADDVNHISNYLIECSRFIPSEFARKTRSLLDLPYYKATELRLHLLYVTPVAFKRFLPPKFYHHFLLLHVAIKILVDEEKCKPFASYAETLLKIFVKDSATLYGDSFITYNIHVLIHLVLDVLRYGNLDKFSCFQFENKNQVIKNQVSSSAKILQQAVRREEEKKWKEATDDSSVPPLNHNVSLLNLHYDGPLVNELDFCLQFKNAQYKSVHLSTKIPQNCVMLYDKTIVLIQNFVSLHGRKFIIGHPFLQKDALFHYPLSSFSLDELIVSHLSFDYFSWPIESILCKMFIIPMPETFDQYEMEVDAVFDEHDSLFYVSPLKMNQ